MIHGKMTKQEVSDAVLPLFLGWDQGGHAAVGDMEKLQHLIIAGQTSTGLGDYINSLLRPLLHQASGQEVRLLLIPSPSGKLLRYDGDPHLLFPMPTDTRQAVHALQKALMEMEQRRSIFSTAGVKNLREYNALTGTESMPTILVVLEELAGLMKAAADETEKIICQIARQGHTAGIHMILATRYPVPQVITGLIKANIPSRVAFATGSLMESRVIIDTRGAEHLGEGELIYWPLGGEHIRLRSVQTLETL